MIEPRHPSTIPSPDAGPAREGDETLSKRGNERIDARISSSEYLQFFHALVEPRKDVPLGLCARRDR